MVNISGTATKFIGGMVAAVVLILLAANLIPEVQTAGNELNATGVPLGSLFEASGIVPLLLVIGVFLAVLGFAFIKGRK